MSFFMHVPRVRIHMNRIRSNYEVLREHAAVGSVGPAGQEMHVAGSDGFWPALMPVVKSDAYGHGQVETAACLVRCGATLLATGSVDEAVLLRQSLEKDSGVRIVALLGLLEPKDVAAAAAFSIIPVVHCFKQLDMLCSALARPGRIAIKCNTGMARLGFGPGDLPALADRLAAMPDIEPAMLLSHLATGDMPETEDVLDSQILLYRSMLDALRSRWPRMAASLCNSAGTLLGERVTRTLGPHIRRPGLALYGVNPFAGTVQEPLGRRLEPAMEVVTRVMGVRTLSRGESIGYGHTYTAAEDLRVAIIAAGYADGFSRGLSNRGAVCVNGVRAPVLGRVSMQMTAVDVSSAGPVAPGATVHLLGGGGSGRVDPADLASWWGTIPYEVLCLLGNNPRSLAG